MPAKNAMPAAMPAKVAMPRSIDRFVVRRRVTWSLVSLLAGGLLSTAPVTVPARDLSGISGAEATSAVRAALEKGSAAAVASLGVENGFLGNPAVRIPLPEGLQRAESVMKLMGRQQQFDELAVSINRAAESAVSLAKPLLQSAIQSMSVADAKAVITGGDDAVTRFFRDRTEVDLTAKFLPIVRQTTEKTGLARQYNNLAGQAASFGAIKEEEAKIENYVTSRALDGLFRMIAEQERAIRRDPVGTGSAILKKVFGAR